MCQKTVSQPAAQLDVAVQNIVTELTKANKLFSAFDVTSVVRAQGLTCYHTQVRQLVHDLYAQGSIFPTDYTRTNHQFQDPNGRLVTAFVFYPNWEDVSNYDSEAIRNSASQIITSSATIPVVQAQNAANANHTDKRGRFCIRRSDVEAAGFVGAHVHVIIGTGQIRVIPFTAQAAKDYPTSAHRYVVDRNGNIRIAKKLISESGVTNFTTVVQTGEIVLR